MKGILIVVAVVVIAALLGWLVFSVDGDTASVTLDKQEVQRDTEAAVESVKDAAQQIDVTDDDNAPAEEQVVPPVEDREPSTPY